MISILCHLSVVGIEPATSRWFHLEVLWTKRCWTHGATDIGVYALVPQDLYMKYYVNVYKSYI